MENFWDSDVWGLLNLLAVLLLSLLAAAFLRRVFRRRRDRPAGSDHLPLPGAGLHRFGFPAFRGKTDPETDG